MPFEFCLNPNRALDLTVVLCRGHIQSHPVICNWLSSTFFFFFVFNVHVFAFSFFFLFCFIGSFFCYIRVERTLFLCGLSRIYLDELFGVNFHGENKPSCHLKDEVRARQTGACCNNCRGNMKTFFYSFLSLVSFSFFL